MSNRAADWELLAGLFLENGSPPAFRHRMGLRRAGVRDFYAPTPEAGVIRAGKERVLQGPGGDAYVLTSEAGRPAAAEFARLLGAPPAATPGGGEADADAAAAKALALGLEPDFLLLIGPSRWELAWAAVCFPTRWSLEGKRGRPLTEIHAVVPALNAELGRKIAVFFERLAPVAVATPEDEAGGWTRANWGLTTSAERNQHPRLPLAPIRADTPPEAVFLRVEVQHFCKLPGSGAIAFGIRVVHFALPEVLARAGLGAALREQLRTMPAAVAAYKGIPTGFAGMTKDQ